MPKTAEPWSLTSLREKLIKIGAKVVSHGRYVTRRTAMKFGRNQPRSQPIVRVARLGGPELVLLRSSRHTSAFVVCLI